MPSVRMLSISAAMFRLRRGVTVCCWAAGLALAVQTVIWSLATYTDLRSTEVKAPAKAPAVVKQGEKPADSVGRLAGRTSSGSGAAAPKAEPAAEDTSLPMRKLNDNNRYFRYAVQASTTIGTLAVVLLIPLMMVGVVLGAGGAIPGVEKTVSAMGWSIVLALLILPVARWLPLINLTGAFCSYDQMIEQVDALRGESAIVGGGPMFYVRFLLLPATCVIGLVLVGLRFAAGVEAALVPGESMSLDPALEDEVAKIKPGSLHGGGRSAAALRAVGPKEHDLAASPLATSATKVSPGAMPRRLI